MTQRTTRDPRPAHEPRPAPPSTLRSASLEELLLSALSGGEEQSIAGGIEAAAKDLEPLYEYFGSRGERWVSTNVHQVQQRLRVLAELLRRQDRQTKRAS